MRARLVFTHPAGQVPDENMAPATPWLLVEDQNVGLFTSDWMCHFGAVKLEEVTEAEVRRQLELNENIMVYLTEARELPCDYLFAPEVSVFRHRWWQEVATRLRSNPTLTTVA